MMKEWMEELCGLLKQEGNLQEITIDVENCLGGLTLAPVEGLGVTKA